MLSLIKLQFGNIQVIKKIVSTINIFIKIRYQPFSLIDSEVSVALEK